MTGRINQKIDSPEYRLKPEEYVLRATDYYYRGEFELAIDHKLGTNFPSDRRTALVEAKHKAEKQRLRLVQRFIQKSIKEKAFASGMQVWLEQLADAFAKVLSPEELSVFLELHEGEKPVFPIEVKKL